MQREWSAFVARRNPDVLEERNLDDFLFGAQRIGLERVRSPLRLLQDGRCFYCRVQLTGAPHVDHFLPWSRSSDNGVDNLVAAHASCNRAKKASLAAVGHLQRWVERNADDRLTELADDAGWPRSKERTHNTARAVYLWAPPGTLLWRDRDEFEPIDGLLVTAMLGARDRLPLAAEDGERYER